QFLMTGPFNPTGPGDTASRRRIFVCRPEAVAEERPCASRILAPLVRLAYRGLQTEADLDVLLEFFDSGRQESGTFEGGIDFALRRMLASPKFVFRVGQDPEHVGP